MAESFHNRMSKIFSYISEDEDKKIVLFEKRLHSYLYTILCFVLFFLLSVAVAISVLHSLSWMFFNPNEMFDVLPN